MKNQEHIIFLCNSNYTVNAFCVGKCSEFRKTTLLGITLLRTLLLEFSGGCS